MGYITWKYLLPCHKLPFNFAVCFAVQNFLFWCSPNSSFLLLFPFRGPIYKKVAMVDAREIIAVLSTRIFMVSGLPLRSLIYFEFIFVYGIRKWYFFSVSFFCTWSSSFPTPFVEEIILFPLDILYCFVENYLTI